MKSKPLYIETTIAADMDKVWEYTQNPDLHQEWDLRFSEIDYLPKHHPTEPQQFLYATKLGLGLRVEGTGESVATKTKTNGESISALKFFSDSPISLIQKGSGYWKYRPFAGGVRFITGYDYEVRWGLWGKITDSLFFRPWMQWATAWSFDCLKNWLEKGIHPKLSFRAQWVLWCVHLVLAIIWIYQGIVPKILFTDTGELEILKQSGLFPGNENNILTAVGIAEILFGLVLFFVHHKRVHYLNIVALAGLGAGALISDVRVFTLPFNPFSLNLSMMALSVVGLLLIDFVPKATHCITKSHEINL